MIKDIVAARVKGKAVELIDRFVAIYPHRTAMLEEFLVLKKRGIWYIIFFQDTQPWAHKEYSVYARAALKYRP